MTVKRPAAPLPEWVIALVAAIEKSDPTSARLALVPEHVRQTARRWSA